MTKRLTAEEKQGRKPIGRACVFCHEKHLQCDRGRPCKNCVKRGISDNCRDIQRKRAKYLNTANSKSSHSRSQSQTPSYRKQRSLSSVSDSSCQSQSQNSSTASTYNISHQAIFPPISSNAFAANSPIKDTSFALPPTHSDNTGMDIDVDLRVNGNSIMSVNKVEDAASIGVDVSIANETHRDNSPLSDTTIAASRQKLFLMPTQEEHNQSNIQFKETSPLQESTPFQNKIPSPSQLQSHLQQLQQQNSTSQINQLHLQINNKEHTPSPQYQHNIQQSNQKQHSTDRMSALPIKIIDNSLAASELSASLEVVDFDKFNSNFVNQEYLMLTDILASKPTSPSQYSDNNIRPFIQLDMNNLSDNYDTPNSQNYKVPNNATSTSTPQSIGPSSNQKNPPKNEYGTEKDDPEFTSPLITRHIFQTIQDIYSKPITAYNYPSGYHALTKYLKSRFNQHQLLEIIKCMASYRPTFIAATRSLISTDLVYLEQTFQRSLLDYEYLCSLNSSPTIIWRRTGEIVNITPEFSSLTGFSSYDILSKRTFLFEIMDDDSVLKYFKIFKNFAIGNLVTTISTSCKLLKNDKKRKYFNYDYKNDDSENHRFIECSSVWTIKRDIFDVPMLIVGQFLPVLDPGDYKFN